jgi:hypothetical protein
MHPNENDLIESLEEAGAKGLSHAQAVKTSKAAKGEFAAFLADLRSQGLVLGPFKKGLGKFYFAPSNAPSSAKAQARIEEILQLSGAKLTNRQKLEKELGGFLKPFLGDVLSSLKSEGKIVEFKQTNNSIVYAHRKPILELLRLSESPLGRAPASPTSEKPPLTLADLRPAYEKLKARQGGISVVKIYDLLQETGVAREDLHALLRVAARRGQVSLHPATTVNFPPEVVEAGVKLEGERDPRVTVVFKERA